MEDEKYLFVSDVAEKKRTARGIHNKRTHTGKGGKVKFLSDYMSKKEIKAMSGEVKSYRMNDPITWGEFKAMPDDIKALYIKALRQKFGAPDRALYEMLGTTRSNFSYVMNRIGCPAGRRHDKVFDKDGFENWLHGGDERPVEAVEEAEPVESAVEDQYVDLSEKERLLNEIGFQREQIMRLTKDNEILKAKLEIVYLIFGNGDMKK